MFSYLTIIKVGQAACISRSQTEPRDEEGSSSQATAKATAKSASAGTEAACRQFAHHSTAKPAFFAAAPANFTTA